MFATFDEIPSLPVQDIKENPKYRGQRITRGNNKNWTLALSFLLQMFILWISMCLQNLMKFHPRLFKLLRKNQNVADYELQRAIALKELGSSPYFSIINVHLVDIIVFAKFYAIIPSLPFQDIGKPKRRGRTARKQYITAHKNSLRWGGGGWRGVY